MPRIINISNLQQFTAINALGTDLGAIAGPVVVPACAQIVLNWSLANGKTAHNVLYGRYVGAFAGSSAQALAIGNALTTGGPATALAPFLHSGTSLNGLTIRNVSLADQPLIGAAITPLTGSATGAPLPGETAVVITERTALAGRANRGRLFIPGWGQAAAFTGDVIIATAVTALGNWANTIIGALAASGYTLVIGQLARAAYTSPTTGRVFAARPAGSVTVTSLIVRDNHWDSQRRRGLK